MSLVQKTARLAARSLGHNSWLIRQLRPTYETLLDVAGGGQGIFWEINGVPYRIDPHQRHRLGQNYDAPVAAFLRERVKPGAICLDVGANVGIYVLQFAHWSAPNGRVIAFEPNPEACAVLENHIYLNHLSSRVTVVPAAVGAESGEAELFAAEADGMSRLGAPNQLIAERVTKLNVPVVTLDEYCEEWGIEPDWLFMDIEGFEIAALAGAQRLIARRGHTLGIVVEMHPDIWDSAATTLDQAEALLAKLGLRPMPLQGQADALREYGLVYLAHTEEH